MLHSRGWNVRILALMCRARGQTEHSHKGWVGKKWCWSSGNILDVNYSMASACKIRKKKKRKKKNAKSSSLELRLSRRGWEIQIQIVRKEVSCDTHSNCLFLPLCLFLCIQAENRVQWFIVRLPRSSVWLHLFSMSGLKIRPIFNLNLFF